MIVKTAVGALAGTIWFLTLSAATVLQAQAATTGDTTWPAITWAVVVTLVVVLALRALTAPFGCGVIGALTVCLALGLIEGPTPPSQAGTAFSIPLTFSVGLASVTVWVALAVTLALTVAASRAPRTATPTGD